MPVTLVAGKTYVAHILGTPGPETLAQAAVSKAGAHLVDEVLGVTGEIFEVDGGHRGSRALMGAGFYPGPSPPGRYGSAQLQSQLVARL